MSIVNHDPVLENDIIDGLCVTRVTLVGVHGKFPYEHGNCFSVEAVDGKDYRIVNFVHENLEGLKKYGIKAPWKIRPIGSGCAVIVDSRIPDVCYMDRFCEVCTPKSLLPYPQRLRIERAIDNGSRVETEHLIRCSPGPSLESIGAKPPQWKSARFSEVDRTEEAPSEDELRKLVQGMLPKEGRLVPAVEYDDAFVDHMETFGFVPVTEDVWLVNTRTAYHFHHHARDLESEGADR